MNLDILLLNILTYIFILKFHSHLFLSQALLAYDLLLNSSGCFNLISILISWSISNLSTLSMVCLQRGHNFSLSFFMHPMQKTWSHFSLVGSVIISMHIEQSQSEKKIYSSQSELSSILIASSKLIFSWTEILFAFYRNFFNNVKRVFVN